MTPQELKVLELTKGTWNAFLELSEMHPDDQNDFRRHVHALQNIILARGGQRILKGIEAAEKLKGITAPSFIEGGIVKGPTNNFLL